MPVLCDAPCLSQAGGRLLVDASVDQKIKAARDQGCTLAEIAASVDVCPATVSNRLRVMATAGYVDPRREALPAGDAISWGAISRSPYRSEAVDLPRIGGSPRCGPYIAYSR